MNPARRKHVVGVALLILAVAMAALPALMRSMSSISPKGTRCTVSVNSADLYELTELYGVGETLAQAIIDEREAHGPFHYPEDLLAVRGIGQKKLAGFRDALDLAPPGEDIEH